MASSVPCVGIYNSGLVSLGSTFFNPTMSGPNCEEICVMGKTPGRQEPDLERRDRFNHTLLVAYQQSRVDGLAQNSEWSTSL